MRIVFIGPPGAGKGTQALRIASHFWLEHLSTGDMLRAAREARDPLGIEAGKYLDQGKLVPDEIVLELVARALSQDHDSAGFLCDGFPRTRAQAESLDRLFAEGSMPLTAAIEFVVPEEELFRRLSGRGRTDDSPETIRNRMKEYDGITVPLVAYYEQQGVLRRVDALGTTDEVLKC